jgi:tetratricopeptide (TPR) repeat protein
MVLLEHMQKIIFGIIIFLIVIGVAIAFILANPPQKEGELDDVVEIVDLEEQDQDIDDAFLEKLATRHPKGEEYVTAMVEARLLLEDDDQSNDLSAITEIGVYLNLLGEKERALGWYQGALSMDPTNVAALNNMANIYDELERYEEAEATWLALLLAYPDRVPAYRSLGYLYRFRLNKSSEDIEALFVKGFEATDNHPDLYNWLTSYFLETGNNEKFAEYANRLNEIFQPQ